MPFPIRCLPPLSCATLCFFSTTRVSRFVECLSCRIWLTALLLQQVVCRDEEKRDGNGEKRDGNGEKRGGNGEHTDGNGEYNNTPLESSLRLCHTRKDTLATLATLSLSQVDILRVALHLCSEDSGCFIDASLIELIRHIDPVQSVVEVTREVGCVIALTTLQQRRALYWLVRVLEKSTSRIPFCARELVDEEQVRLHVRFNPRSHSLSFSLSVCDTKQFSSLPKCTLHTPYPWSIRSTKCINSPVNHHLPVVLMTTMQFPIYMKHPL